MRLEKKCWPESFEKILSGEKTFDVRLCDFECNPGDTLVLKEWNPDKGSFTGRSLEKTVGFVSKLNELRYWPKEAVAQKGLQVISLK